MRDAMNASLPISLTVVEPPDSTDLAGHQSEMYLITGALNGRGGPLVHSLAQTMTSYLASMHPPRNSMNAFWEAWDPEVRPCRFRGCFCVALCTGDAGNTTDTAVRVALHPKTTDRDASCGAMHVLERAHR